MIKRFMIDLIITTALLPMGGSVLLSQCEDDLVGSWETIGYLNDDAQVTELSLETYVWKFDGGTRWCYTARGDGRELFNTTAYIVNGCTMSFPLNEEKSRMEFEVIRDTLYISQITDQDDIIFVLKKAN